MAIVALIVVLVLSIAGCRRMESDDRQEADTLGSRPTGETTQPISFEDLEIVTGQQLYVPAYSEIQQRRELYL